VNRLHIRNLTRGSVLSEQAEVADTSRRRRTGLLKHDCLPPGCGLWIVPCEGIHTFGMKFPIDVVFLDRAKKVLKTRVDMGPRRLSLCLRAHSVLELPAGTVAATRTQPGDRLEFDEQGS
jgi:uncharacterized protein